MPTLIAVSPSSGPVGTPVTISGTNLTATTQVTVSCNLPNLPAPFTVVSDTVIHATVPVGAKLGVCGVTVASPNGGAGIGGVVTPPQPGSFTVTAGAPPPPGTPFPPATTPPPAAPPGTVSFIGVALFHTQAVTICEFFTGTFPILANCAQPGETLLGALTLVTAGGTAPTTNTVVTLTASNPQALAVPATVTIPAGSLTANFSATAGSGCLANVGLGAGTASGAQGGYQVQVEPLPLLQLPPADFTLAMAVQNLAWGFLQPVAGALAVRP